MSPAPRWEAVRAWLRSLRGALPALDLSPEGATLARDVALEALSDDVLERVAALDGQPFDHARFVAARTVATAPLEWLAVLLGRGTAVDLQVPSKPSDTGRLWAAWAPRAQQAGLPLRLVRRGEGAGAPLVVLMGDDDSVADVAASLPDCTRFLGFGARYSAAVCEDEADVASIVQDLVLHDGRGCMSPGLVLVPDAGRLPELQDAFVDALAEAEVRWPRGQVSDADLAAIRSRGALARVLGAERHGPAWALHTLPWARRTPASLPRAPLLVVPPAPDQAIAALAADPRLSTLGTRRTVTPAPGVRIVSVGQQQRPPVERLHDGVDWLVATLRHGPRGPGGNGDILGHCPTEAT